ncbi:hypothetical protein ACJX0J_027403, partial [Zea mays]
VPSGTNVEYASFNVACHPHGQTLLRKKMKIELSRMINSKFNEDLGPYTFKLDLNYMKSYMLAKNIPKC